MTNIFTPLQMIRKHLKRSNNFSAGAQQRALAAHILNQVIHEKRSLSTSLVELDKTMNDPTSISVSLIKELCYGTLRHYFELDHVAKQLLKKPLPRKNNILHCLILTGLYQIAYTRIPDHAALNETVNATSILKMPWAKGLCNKLLRRFTKEKDSVISNAHKNKVARYSHPEWLVDLIQQDWPEYSENILNNNNQHAPQFLRVNSTLVSRDEYLETLQAKDIIASVIPDVPDAIKVEQPLPVNKIPGFKEGFVSLQDIAGQLAAQVLDIQPSLNILDACAAPGSKTSHILELFPDITKIVAIDKDSERLIKVKENMQRLQLPNNKIRLVLADAAHTKEWWDGDLFDRILLDAPCSGTGVIRRHPDIKLLRTAEDIPAVAKEQRFLLHALWSLLAPQGKLLYSTCSILQDENDKQISSFLKDHQDAKVLNLRLPFGVKSKHGYQLFPDANGSDGFYYCLLQKT